MTDEAETAARGCAYGLVGCAAFAILFAVIGFGSLWYLGFVQRGGVYDDLRIQLAQSQLNQLVPYVELYRTQRGEYPTAIEQVAEVIPDGTPLSVMDASAPPTGAQRHFFYERIGDDHYVLRALGADGAPYTADDLVPQGFDAAGIGLLLEQPAPQTSPSAPPPGAPDATSAPLPPLSSDSPR
jgi:hypothetical protein